MLTGLDIFTQHWVNDDPRSVYELSKVWRGVDREGNYGMDPFYVEFAKSKLRDMKTWSNSKLERLILEQIDSKSADELFERWEAFIEPDLPEPLNVQVWRGHRNRNHAYTSLKYFFTKQKLQGTTITYYFLRYFPRVLLADFGIDASYINAVNHPRYKEWAKVNYHNLLELLFIGLMRPLALPMRGGTRRARRTKKRTRRARR